ncbi:MAG: FkbM family methyltransferase [Acidobacteriota bacterium]|nr:FkbM family methyltransferase [Acidobacteriota bacterium]
MGANSIFRKAAKKVLYPLVNEKTYKYIQAVSKAWDIKTGSWKEPEIDLVEMGLKNGETAIDIGANYGLYAYYMSRAVGREGKVYCFEPIPFTFDCLKIVSKMLGFSHNVELVNKGCSNENSKVTFSIPVQQSGAVAAGLAYIGKRNDNRSGKETQVRWSATTEVEADVVRLDDFLPETKDLTFVKIDIEGAEPFALKGAEKLFLKHLPTTICEINPWYLEGFGFRTEDLTSFFLEKGYKIFFYSNEAGKKLKQVETGDIVEDNYLFLHPRRFDRFKEILPDSVEL